MSFGLALQYFSGVRDEDGTFGTHVAVHGDVFDDAIDILLEAFSIITHLNETTIWGGFCSVFHISAAIQRNRTIALNITRFVIGEESIIEFGGLSTGALIHVETDYRRIAAIRNDAFRVNDTDFGDIEIGLLTEGGEIRVNYTIAVIALDIDIIVFEFRFDATRKRQEVRVGGIGNIVFNIGDIETQGAISIG
jgi:hypothetical protein